MKKTALVVFLSLCSVISSGLFASSGEAPAGKIFFVSPQGNDAWSGTLSKPTHGQTDGPFATITRARDAIRQMKREGSFNQPVTVYLRGGMFFLDETVVFTPEDSGTKEYPIRYVNFGNESPVLSGGRRLDVEWTARGTNRIQATLPEVKNGQWYFYQLFVDGERWTRARTPNEGFHTMVGEVPLEGPARFTFQDGDIKKEWEEYGDVDVIGLSKWTEIRMPIVEVDETHHTATLTKPAPNSSWQGEKNPRYWIENAPEALDQPGEWRLERKSGILTLNLKSSQQPASVIAPRLTNLIRLEGDPQAEKTVNYLSFEGLTFQHSRTSHLEEGYGDVQAAYNIDAAFMATGAEHCVVQQCRFTQLGNYAVEFNQGCKYNRIAGNEMSDLGAGGVKIGEGALRTEDPLITRHNEVTDNRIHHIGIIYPAAVGVWVGQSDHNTIAHNHIHHTYYTGISVGWTWGYSPTGAHHNIIEFNHVHDIGQGILSDMGGIYTLGTQPGTVIRNNIFHDIQSFSYGGWGIYPDEGSTQIRIENNITYRTKSAGFHQHYGKENVIRNNIFALAKEYQVMRTRAEEHLSFTFERNIVYFDEGELLGSNWSGSNYRCDYNLYWNPKVRDFKFANWTWDEWRAKGQDTHSRIADPLFVDPEHDDFRLKPGSPTLELGFHPIDVSQVGPRP
ncbi:MAG: right-handed parallel beta-helix repeat-containing protein [bacterium]